MRRVWATGAGFWLMVALTLGGPAYGQQWQSSFHQLAAKYCVDCHEGPDAEANLDLTSLRDDLGDLDQRRRWIRIHDRLAAHEMPPASEPAPSDDVRRSILDELSSALIHAERDQSDVVLRRLNRFEYENTVRDLFGVDVSVKQLLPEDTPTAGFDNVGEGLAVSAEAVQAYLNAADRVLDAALGPAQPPKRIELKTNLLDQKGHDGSSFIDRHIGTMFRRTERGLVIFQSGYCPTNLVNFGRLRPPAGTYRATFHVRAVQSDRPVTLRIYGGDTLVGRREKHLVGYYDVPPGEWTTIEFTDRLVEDGGMFQPKCYGTRDTRKDADTYPEPGIEIGDIYIEGPLEAWPPPSRAVLLGNTDLQTAGSAQVEPIIARLLPRAFRRDVTQDEVRFYGSLAQAALENGRSFEEAIRQSVRAILCSPDFLFLDEPARASGSEAEDQSLEPFALASRLSYFLWSSMPDDRLLSLARKGQLDSPEVLRNEVERMLKDEKAQAFRNNFTGQWLDLREIDFTEPDPNLYPEFDELLKISMLEETRLFFAEILEADLSILNFVDSDFTFLNERLARHYGIDGVEGQTFRRVALPADSVRGGVLTQASLLKVTANGTNTSPVMRGNWVLENVLGHPTPPPPDGVGSVEPDIRGATTLREQLAKHRNSESCAVCHRRIDPPGFALENFDPIGGWRDRYRTVEEGERPKLKQAPFTFAWVRYRIGLPVDASGVAASGEPFEDVREYKKLLLRDREAITKCLTIKLLTYALGRQVGFADRPSVDRIVARTSEANYGLRTLVHEIVQSELFRRP